MLTLALNSALRIGAFLVVAIGFTASTIGSPDSFELREAQELKVRAGLPNSLTKLRSNQPVCIAYLGGSITAQRGWRVLTTAWFRERFPQAKIVEVDATLGGTGSELGVFRIDRQVIPYSPDLLFVEFAVNDSLALPAHTQKTMEGIVRKIWRANSRTDICFVYTLKQNMLGDLQSGKFPTSASAMEYVAEHYGIPSIHMGIETAKLEQQGELIFQGPKGVFPVEGATSDEKIVFSPDGVHPYLSSGHVLYFQAIERSMRAIEKDPAKPVEHNLGKPLMEDNWEDAKTISLDQVKLSSGWKQLDSNKDHLAKVFQKTLPTLYRAEKPGESISFQFLGTDAKIFDLMGPDCGKVLVQVDDQPAVSHFRFDSYCISSRIGALPVATELPNQVHRVTLTIDTEKPDKKTILAKHGNTMDDPQRFEGVTWYASAILLRGTLVQSEFDTTKSATSETHEHHSND